MYKFLDNLSDNSFSAGLVLYHFVKIYLHLIDKLSKMRIDKFND